MDEDIRKKSIVYLVEKVFVPQVIFRFENYHKESLKNYEISMQVSAIVGKPIISPDPGVIDIQQPAQELTENILRMLHAAEQNERNKFAQALTALDFSETTVKELKERLKLT